jgi:hypothetical protein
MKNIRMISVRVLAMVVALLVALSATNSHAAVEIASSPLKSVSSLVFNGATSGTVAGNATLAHFIYANNGIIAGEPPTPTTTAPEPASMAKFAGVAALGMVSFVMFRRKLSAV